MKWSTLARIAGECVIAIGTIVTMLVVVIPAFTIATVIVIKRHGKKHD